ncbi:hypothetical protein AB0C21_06975 [Spirillospora sp. NPDC049024]
MTTEPRAAPSAGRFGVLPRWTGKPVRRLTTAELAEALEYLERHHPDDDVLGRALAGEFARRTAAAEFARRAAADRGRALDDVPGGERALGASPPAAPVPADPDGPRRPPLATPPGHPRTPQ